MNARGELLHQITSAGVAVRLEDDVNLAEAALPGRSQSRFDLCGMVSVVVDHTDAGGASAQLEAAINPSKLIERALDRFDINV